MEITGDSEACGQAVSFLREWKDERPYILAKTSGSTGKPKEIRLLKSDMLISAKATCDFFGLKADSSLYLPLPVSYIAGKMMLVRAKVAGATIIVHNPSRKPDICNIDHIDLAAVVPAQVPHLLESLSFKNIRHLIIGGAPLDSVMEECLLQTGVDAYVTYGMTETASHVALRKIGSETYVALPNISFTTDNRQCLIINSPERSFKKLITNDLVELCSPTSFRWLGRADNAINSGGIKVYPEMIEHKVAPIMKGRPFLFSSRQSADWGQEVIMYVEGTEPIGMLEVSLREMLQPAERPKEIIYLEAFQRTASGKIIRN